jgi:uncharacterized protein YyaL (SSP411 family)
MSAVVAMTGQGGWPLSLFLPPDGEPFYGGTYFPPEPRYGVPAFRQVLLAAAHAWQDQPDQLRQTGLDLLHHVAAYSAWGGSQAANLRAEFLDQAVQSLLAAYDWQQGGWGQAPRFPQAMALEFLLRQATNGQEAAHQAVFHNLRLMARGGLYDVVGGGFHRYSTDDDWHMPHFEKMLYDNAQLALAYLHAGLLDGQETFLFTATETLDFILRELTGPEGGFYASLDADSEGEEGRYYLWTHDQLETILGPIGEFEWFRTTYGLADRSQDERPTVLRRVAELPELADRLGFTVQELAVRLEHAHQALRAQRASRMRPAADDKLLVAWNALAIRSFAEAGRYLGRADYLQAAQNCASFILANLFDGQRLLRSWRAGRAHQSAFLEDHAALILGLLALYQADFDSRWFTAAQELAQHMVAHFADPAGGFFDTPDDLEDLPLRTKDFQDNATPCGNSLAACALLQLEQFDGQSQREAAIQATLSTLQDTLIRHPTAFGMWLQAADALLVPPQQIALLAPTQLTQLAPYLERINCRWRPHTTLAAATLPLPGAAPALLDQRDLLNGLATAYVCQHFTCRLPVNQPAQLDQLLN